jgi:hypothetical protein
MPSPNRLISLKSPVWAIADRDPIRVNGAFIHSGE